MEPKEILTFAVNALVPSYGFGTHNAQVKSRHQEVMASIKTKPENLSPTDLAMDGSMKIDGFNRTPVIVKALGKMGEVSCDDFWTESGLPKPADGTDLYEIISGHHRWASAIRCGIPTLNGIITEANDSPQGLYETARAVFVDNLHKPLSAPATTESVYKLFSTKLEALVAEYSAANEGKTPNPKKLADLRKQAEGEIGKLIGRDAQTVRQHLNISEKLIPEIQAMYSMDTPAMTQFVASRISVQPEDLQKAIFNALAGWMDKIGEPLTGAKLKEVVEDCIRYTKQVKDPEVATETVVAAATAIPEAPSPVPTGETKQEAVSPAPAEPEAPKTPASESDAQKKVDSSTPKPRHWTNAQVEGMIAMLKKLDKTAVPCAVFAVILEMASGKCGREEALVAMEAAVGESNKEAAVTFYNMVLKATAVE